MAKRKGETKPRDMLLTPPQIQKSIRKYIRGRRPQADRLWSMVRGSAALQRAWKAFAKADREKDFCKPDWSAHTFLHGLEESLRAGYSEMHRNPRHLMLLCQKPLMVSLACDVFATLDGWPADEQAHAAYFADALIAHVAEKMGELMDAGHVPADFWPDRWWRYRIWDDAVVNLARARDPLRVARWIADVNPLVAERCLMESGHDLDPTEVGKLISELGDIARGHWGDYWGDWTAESDIKSEGEVVDPLPSLISLYLRSLPTPDPSILQQDISAIFDSSIWSKDYLHTNADQLSELLPAHRTKPLILFFEDEPAMGMLIELILSRRFDNQILVLSSSGKIYGLEGVRLASALVPDLIMTDVAEPEMDGFTFAAYLKENPITQHVPLMFCTARGSPADLRIGFALGAVRYMTKPFLPQELLDAVRDVLGIEYRDAPR